jgi:hypothetical protein
MNPASKRSSKAVCVGFVLFHLTNIVGQEAAAADWELLSQFDQTLTFSDNIQAEANPDGPGGISNSRLNLDLNAYTPRAEWGLNGNIGYLSYFGDGKPDDSKLLNLFGETDFLKKTRLNDYSLSAFVRRSPSTTSELADVGIVEFDSEQLTYGISGGLIHHLNTRNELSMGIGASWIDFSRNSDELSPSQTVNLNAEWTRKLAHRSDGRLRATIDWRQLDDEENTETIIYKTTVGTEARLTRRLFIEIDAGVAFLEQYQRDLLASGTGKERDSASGFVGDFLLRYTPRRDVQLGISMGQDVGFDNLGDLRASRYANASIIYDINDHSNFSLSASFRRSKTGGENNDALITTSVTPTYSHQITKEWYGVIGYQWLRSDRDVEVGISNRVFFTLAHRYSAIP